MREINTVEYTEKLGDFTMPDGAQDALRALPLEEQMKFFAIEVTGSNISTYRDSLTSSFDTKSLIVNGGIIVGVMISNEYGISVPCFIGESICTWDSSDNNGAGYKCRTEYAKLLFVNPKND